MFHKTGPKSRVISRNGGRNWIRTSEGVSQQIYSLPPLATWVSYQLLNRGGINSNPHSVVNKRTRPAISLDRFHRLSRDVRAFSQDSRPSLHFAHRSLRIF